MLPYTLVGASVSQSGKLFLHVPAIAPKFLKLYSLFGVMMIDPKDPW